MFFDKWDGICEKILLKYSNNWETGEIYDQS